MYSLYKCGRILIFILIMYCAVLAFSPFPLFVQQPSPAFIGESRNLILSENVEFSNFNEFHTAQDDPMLIEFIKRKVLVPPASPGSKLNLSNPIRNRRQTAIVAKLLKNKTNGFFVEANALDGERLSNSIEFEHHFQWRGLLMEGDPMYKSQLLSKNRKAWIAPVCMSPKTYPMSISFVSRTTLSSDLVNDGFRFPTKFQIQCLPLYSLLLALNQTEVDYLSLDVDGDELSVIQTIPLYKIKIKILHLKNSRPAYYQEIESYLNAMGYKMYDSLEERYIQGYLFARL